MPEFVRSAVSFLSLLVAVAVAAPAAELVEVSDPARLHSLFPDEARLRMVNVWATWCAPCVAEMPDLQAIDDIFGPELAVLGISLDDALPGADKSKVSRFLMNKKISFPNVYFTGTPDRLGERLRYSGEIPITILFDRTGKELWRHQGRIDKQTTIATIRDRLRRNR